MNKIYGGIIWTDHALERLRQRGISQGDAWATFNRPDHSRLGQKKGVFVYYKTWEYTNVHGHKKYQQIEVVATRNEKKEWIVLSVWAKPVSAKEYNPKVSLIKRIARILGIG